MAGLDASMPSCSPLSVVAEPRSARQLEHVGSRSCRRTDVADRRAMIAQQTPVAAVSTRNKPVAGSRRRHGYLDRSNVGPSNNERGKIGALIDLDQSRLEDTSIDKCHAERARSVAEQMRARDNHA